jgi:glycopeptide antibiotics resistance protein
MCRRGRPGGGRVDARQGGTLLTGAIVYPVAFVAAIAVAWHGVARHRPWWQVTAAVLLVLYIGWVIGATLFPIYLEGRSAPEELVSTLNHPNLVPLRSIRETLALDGVWQRVRLLAGNVVVFSPFGLLLPIIWPRLARFWRMALAGLLFSAGIELSQLGLSLVLGYWYRMTDVDDVLLNVTGVLLGYGLLRLLRWRRGGPEAKDAFSGPPI